MKIRGLAQEEQLEIQSPESLILLLFCEKMSDKEAIEIIGCERFIKYEGYRKTTKFAGQFIDDRDVTNNVLNSDVL